MGGSEGLQRLAKRALDVIVASVLLVLATPLMVLAGLLVRRRSPGPPIFAQRREGLGGRSFTLYKIRTMQSDAEAALDETLRSDPEARDEWDRYARLENDPRIVPGIGSWLRRSSIDELPQLWNVVRGDMSLVGPRALEPQVAARLPAEARAVRSAVLPGMTGLWQVSGRSETDLEELCRVDRSYVERWSLWLDLLILLKTPAAVLSRRGAY